MMNSERIEEIQKQCACPESQSVFTALHQVWNEVGQEYQNELREKEARIAELEKSLSGLQRRLQERFEFALGQISSDLQAEYEHSIKVLSKSERESFADLKTQIGRDSFMRGVYFVEATALQNHDTIPLGARRRIANEAADKYAEEIRQQADKG